MDCSPFYHGYGENCSDAERTIGTWKLPVTDHAGKVVHIRFYVTPGKGILLLGNEICHRSNILGPKNIIETPPGVLSNGRHILQTYSEPVGPKKSNAMRTYLLVLPVKMGQFKTFLSNSLDSEDTVQPNPTEKQKAKRFAVKLHSFSHLSVEDMKTICNRAGVLTREIEAALAEAFEKCTSCKQTGRPLNSRSVSLGKVLAEFNSHVQIDFLYVTEIGPKPILHVIDTHSSLSATALSPSRDIGVAARTIEQIWINTHGPPAKISGDPEFVNNKFAKLMERFSITIEPRAARRHQKIGIVERKNAVVRTLIQRLLKDVEFMQHARRAVNVDGDDQERLNNHIVSRATYLSNILYGSRTRSSFEMSRGYTPSIAGLPQSTVSDELKKADEEQRAKRALKSVENCRTPRALSKNELQRDTAVYYFRRVPRPPKWIKAHVRKAEDHIVLLSTRPDHAGKPVRAAYEDVRIMPTAPLLRELDEIDPLFPRSVDIVEDELEDISEETSQAPMDPFEAEEQVPAPQPAEQPDTIVECPTAEQPRADTVETLDASRNHEKELDREIDELLIETFLFPDVAELPESELPPLGSFYTNELDLWKRHPTTASILSNSRPKRVDDPSKDVHVSCLGTAGRALLSNNNQVKLDLNTPHNPPRPDKDIGSIDVLPPPSLPIDLKSTEQKLLYDIKQVIGDKPVSEFRLQFAPRWLIDKAINNEKQNYKLAKAYEEVPLSSLAKDANIITSHHFFEVKFDGLLEMLKLKCRLVPHGNKDRDKESLRTDSATAQFPIIRIVISTSVILGFKLAFIDIKSAYLQAGDLPRLIYVKPPPGWAPPGMVWRLLKPAYGLVESGRLWLLAIERWFSTVGIFEVPGLPQLFAKRDANGHLILIIAKVIDDLIIAGEPEVTDQFHRDISAKFKVGRYLTDPEAIFNRLNISTKPNGDVEISMEEYLSTIQPIDIPRDRRKQQHELCTKREMKAFLGLTGSLNFLGHGVLPQASFMASHLQQCVGRLTVAHLCTANKCLQEIKSLRPMLLYKKPTSLESPTYLSFSDASQGKTSYGQTGYLSGIFLPANGGGIYHLLDWLSGKQGRVAFSSTGSEINAAATSTDRGSMMAECLTVFFGSKKQLPFSLIVDSHGLYSTITTLREGADYRLRPTVSRLRDSFENGEISTMQWIPGTENLADALTKRNIVMFRKLNDVMTSGFLNIELLKDAVRSKFD